MTRQRPETHIRVGVRGFFRTVGFGVYDLEQNRPTRQTPGFVDLVAFGHGRILFIETKSRTGRLSRWQLVMRELVLEQALAGVFHLVLRSTAEAAEWWERERRRGSTLHPCAH